MSVKYPPEIIDRVREATDIVAVISEHVRLKKAGRAMKGLCPFHQEKTPSFHVNPDRQIFKCFGCGAGGDVYRFLMDAEKMTFPEAIQLLAGKAGITLPRSVWAPAEEQSVFPVLEWAASFYRTELAGRTGGAAREYLQKRGLLPETVTRFGLGWAPPGWDGLLKAAERRFSVALLARAGLVIENERGGYYDRFRSRVIVPIRTPLGRTVGFGARTLGPEEPKYVNSSETEVFQKGKILFGLPEAKEALKNAEEAIVVEGYMDTMALSQGGIGNVVASCGTAFTENQAALLRRYVERAVLLFDGDAAGIRAAWKSAGTFLAAGLTVRIVALPSGHDPDSFVREHGPDQLMTTIAEAPGVVGFAQKVLLDRVERREDLIKAFAVLGAVIDDPIRRRLLLQEAAERLRFDEDTLIRETAAQRGEKGPARRTAVAPARASTEAKDPLGRAYMGMLLAASDPPEDHVIDPAALREAGLRELYGHWRELRDGGVPEPRLRLLEDPAFQDRVSELLAEEDWPAEAMPEIVGRLEERVRMEKGKTLQEAIREAEARGDPALARQLLAEHQALKDVG
jgi:DNA primase